MADNAFLIAAMGALAAGGGFLLNVIKSLFDARRSREVSARDAWEKYLIMAFDHPDLALAIYKTPVKFEKYEWFVSRMLYAAEEVLLYVGPDEAWQNAIGDQVSFHEDYLKDQGTKYLGSYGPALQEVFRRQKLPWVPPKTKWWRRILRKLG